MTHMFDFLQYIQSKLYPIDGHIHLFSHEGPALAISPSGVGFPDVFVRSHEELYDRQHLDDMYAEYINRWPGYTVLATALNPDDAIYIQQKYNLKGFGELKCYPTHKVNGVDEPLPYKSIKYWRPLFTYANEHHLPIWIHWSLMSQDDLDKLLACVRMYRNVNFVLCHCGIDAKETYPEQAFCMCMEFLKEPNAYTDVSFTAADFLLENPQYKLPSNKYIVGSDATPHDREYEADIRAKYIAVYKILGCNNEVNLKRIFK